VTGSDAGPALHLMLANIPALLIFCFASSVTPGPNNIMLMTSGLNFGWRRTLPHFWGVDIGYGLLVAGIGFGLAAVLARVPALLVALKWTGAAYLVVLAVKIARASSPQSGTPRGAPLTFLEAVAFQWVNPKAWLQALTACATFTVPNAYLASVAVLALVMAIINLPCAALWTGFGTGLKTWLSRPGRLAGFNYLMAGLLILSLYPILRS
jgi:threonine/homoserine/homoserine lactone efflux protein